MKKIRVFIADDHAILRDGLGAFLKLSDNIEVVGGAGTGQEAIDLVPQLLPDIALMDIAMPIIDGIEATRIITGLCPQVKVIILSQHDNREYILSAIKVGASGYILKKSVGADIVTGIEAVYSGGCFFNPDVAKTVVEEYIEKSKHNQIVDDLDRLTEREKEVLKLVAEGHSTNDIAQLLFISIKTVLGHRENIMEKLDIHNRTELIKYAYKKGIIHTEF